MPPRFEFWNRKEDPQKEIDKELAAAQKKHLKHKDSDLKIYQEIKTQISQELSLLQTLRSNFARGLGSISEVVGLKKNARALKKLLQKPKLLQAEDIHIISVKIEEIVSRIDSLETPTVAYTNEPSVGTSPSSKGGAFDHSPSGMEAINIRTQKKIAAAQILADLEEVMKHTLAIIDEREN